MESILTENSIDLPIPIAARWDERLACLISDILCPPVTVPIGLFLFVSSIREPLVWVWALISVALSIGIPVAYVFWKVRSGEISDFHIPIRTQRFRPMLVSILCVLLSWGILQICKAPAPLISLIGVSAALAVLLLLITLRWKISGHSVAIASLAIVIIHVMGQAFLPALLIIPLVAWARVRIHRHTLAQTVAGAALGILYINLAIKM